MVLSSNRNNNYILNIEFLLSSKLPLRVHGEEIQLLLKGLKYNLQHKNIKWIKTLALEAETVRINLNIREQNYYGHAVARNIKDISRKDNVTKKQKEKWKIIANIKHKMY